MFCDLTLISFRAEADDGANDGASDGVFTDNNDDICVIDDVVDDVGAEVCNAADDAVVTGLVTAENGVGNDAFVCDIRFSRMKNIVITFMCVKL